MADCCPEPIPGPVVTDRMLGLAWTALGPLVRGEWPQLHSLAVDDRDDVLTRLDGVLAGLYLAVDADRRLRWFGKSHRDGGVGARLREHLTHPERARVYAGLYVVEADPFAPPGAPASAEGKAADLMELRGTMGPRTWPSSRGWPATLIRTPAIGPQRSAASPVPKKASGTK